VKSSNLLCVSLLLLPIYLPSAYAGNPRGEIHGIAVSPDAKTMAVAYMKGNSGFIYKIDMETGIASRLTEAKTGKESCPAFSADGKLFAYSYVSDRTNQRVIVMDVDGSNSRSLPGSGTANLYPTFSPDGKWVAYVSNATGTNQVYVRPFPGPGAARAPR